MKFFVDRWRRLRNRKQITIWILCVVGVGIVLIIIIPWIMLSASNERNLAIRNIIFAATALIGLPLTIWRSMVAGRQAETAQQGLLNERYQKGAEMLGSEVLSVRLGGIYALQHLASEYHIQYHFQIMRLFCAFVCHPTKDSKEKTERITPQSDETKRTISRSDIQTVMEAIGNRNDEAIELEKEDNFRLDFLGANLSGMRLYDLNLSHAWFREADLSKVCLQKTNLARARFSKTILTCTDLSDAILIEAEFDGVDLSTVHIKGANLTGANLSEVIGLTQEKLNQTKAHHHSPPTLNNTLDAVTGKSLVWPENS